MYFSRKQQWLIFCIVNGLCLFTLLLFPLYRDHLAGTLLTSCKFYKVTGLYCTGCGATRAFNALIHFEILDAFRLNPIIPVGAMFLIIYEITMIVYLAKRKKRPLFVKNWMLWAFFVPWYAYCIIRDILLLNGIDILLGTGL